MTPKQQKEVRAFLSSAKKKHKDEVGKQDQLKAEYVKVENEFKEDYNIEGALTDEQSKELKETRQWLECNIRMKRSMLRVRCLELQLRINQSIPEEQKKSIKKKIDGLGQQEIKEAICD